MRFLQGVKSWRWEGFQFQDFYTRIYCHIELNELDFLWHYISSKILIFGKIFKSIPLAVPEKECLEVTEP